MESSNLSGEDGGGGVGVENQDNDDGSDWESTSDSKSSESWDGSFATWKPTHPIVKKLAKTAYGVPIFDDGYPITGKNKFDSDRSLSSVSSSDSEISFSELMKKNSTKKAGMAKRKNGPIIIPSRKESNIEDTIFAGLRGQLKSSLISKIIKMESFLKSNKISSTDIVKKIKGEKVKPPLPPKPWVEKYRPKTVDDVVEQSEIVSVLKQVLKGADLPHFLFYGPPGTGKTSTIIAAARELFGHAYKDRILELNASDDRGIQVIRDKVKSFAQLTASSVRPDGSPCPPYKIIILDEADSMTKAAQAALRRTMEKETKTTRFCLICNYVSSIIDPLTSRCMKFRFKPLGEGVLRSRLEMICHDEKVNYDSKALTAIVKTCGGDLRQAITCLQSCARLKVGELIIEEDVFDITGVVPQCIIEELLGLCKNGDFEQIADHIRKMLVEAYPMSVVLEQLQTVIVSSDTLPDMAKSKICEKIAVVSSRIQEGACDYLQLVDLCCGMSNVFHDFDE